MQGIEVRSHVGAGGALLGQPRVWAERGLRALSADVFEVGVQQPREAALSFGSGASVQAWFDVADRLEAVEVWGSQECPVVWDGVAVTGLPIREVLDDLRGVDLVAEGDESWVSRSRDAALTVYDGLVVAVLVGVPGYYSFLDGLPG